MLQRREFLALAGSALAAPAFAQSRYPSRPIRVIVPFAAGGIIDVVARIVTEPLPRLLRPLSRKPATLRGPFA